MGVQLDAEPKIRHFSNVPLAAAAAALEQHIAGLEVAVEDGFVVQVQHGLGNVRCRG
jgi:hypothetical protein